MYQCLNWETKSRNQQEEQHLKYCFCMYVFPEAFLWLFFICLFCHILVCFILLQITFYDYYFQDVCFLIREERKYGFGYVVEVEGSGRSLKKQNIIRMYFKNLFLTKNIQTHGN